MNLTWTNILLYLSWQLAAAQLGNKRALAFLEELETQDVQRSNVD